MRRKLIACSVWVTYPGKRMALLKYPTPEMFAPWGSECVEHITTFQGAFECIGMVHKIQNWTH